MVFQMLRDSTPLFSWNAKFRISPINRQGMFGKFFWWNSVGLDPKDWQDKSILSRSYWVFNYFINFPTLDPGISIHIYGIFVHLFTSKKIICSGPLIQLFSILNKWPPVRTPIGPLDLSIGWMYNSAFFGAQPHEFYCCGCQGRSKVSGYIFYGY